MLNPKSFTSFSRFIASLLLSLLISSASLAETKYWIGSGSFSVDANWSTESGGNPDTTAPIAADDAVFDGGGTGNCTIDAVVSVKGLKLESGYSGTISQGAAIAVGTNGYSQSGGTFAGGASDMTIYNFLLSDGSFTAPSGMMMISNNLAENINIFTWQSGSFDHNNGTLAIKSIITSKSARTHSIVLNGKKLELHNLIIAGTKTSGSTYLEYALGSDDTIVVHGNLMFEDLWGGQFSLVYLNNGLIELHGNLSVNDGMLGGTTILKLVGDSDQIYSRTGGELFDTVIVDKPSGSFEPQADLLDFPTKTFILERGTFVAPDNGVFSTSAGYIQTGGTFTPGAGDVSVNSFLLSGGSFTAPEGVMMIANLTSANINIFTWEGGSFNHNNGTLTFRSHVDSWSLYTREISLNGKIIELHNLVIAGGNTRSGRYLNYVLGAEDKIVVHEELLCEGDTDTGQNAAINVQDGVIELQGNLTVKDGMLGGTTSLKLVGDADQTYTVTGGELFDTVIVDKLSGSFEPQADSLDFPAKTFILERGTFVAPDNGVFSTSAGYIQTGGTFTPGAGDMSVNSFLLSGGAFTAPEGVMMIANLTSANINIFNWDGGSFNHNNGILTFRSHIDSSSRYTHSISLNGKIIELHNLVIAGGNTRSGHYLNYALDSEDKIVVHEELLCEGDTDASQNAAIKVPGGVIEAYGNLTVKDGMLGGTATLKLVGDADQTYTVTGGELFDTVIVDKESGSVTPVAGSVQFLTKTFILEKGDFTAPDGLFSASSSYTQRDGAFSSGSGDMTVRSFTLSGGTFTAPEGVMMIENDTLANIDIFTWDGGSFNHNNGTLAFNSWVYKSSSYNHTIDLTGQELETQNLMFSGGNYYSSVNSLNYQLGTEDKLVAHGDLLCEGDTDRNANALIKIQGGIIELQGNLTVKDGMYGCYASDGNGQWRQIG